MKKSVEDIDGIHVIQFIEDQMYHNNHHNNLMQDAERYFTKYVGDDWWKEHKTLRQAIKELIDENTTTISDEIKRYAALQRKSDAEDDLILFSLRQGLKAVEARRQDKLDSELQMWHNTMTYMETLLRMTHSKIIFRIHDFTPDTQEAYKALFRVKPDNSSVTSCPLSVNKGDEDNETRRYAGIESRYEHLDDLFPPGATD